MFLYCYTPYLHTITMSNSPSPSISQEPPTIYTKQTKQAEIISKWSDIPPITKNQFRMFIVRLIRQTPPARSNEKYQETLRNLFTQLTTSLESQLHQLQVPPPPPSLRSTLGKKFKPGWLFTTDSTVDLSSIAQKLETKLKPLEDNVTRLRHQLAIHTEELERRESRLNQYTRTVNNLTEELDRLEENRVCWGI